VGASNLRYSLVVVGRQKLSTNGPSGDAVTAEVLVDALVGVEVVSTVRPLGRIGQEVRDDIEPDEPDPAQLIPPKRRLGAH